MSERLRCFVAVNLPADLQETVGGFIDSLNSRVRGIRWVAKANLHLTLKFLGHVERRDLPAVTSALDEAFAGRRQLRISLCGAGFFPPRGRPRVVWLDMAEGGEGLALFQAGCEEALEPLGFPPEGRPFAPHLTIGRVKDLRDPAPLITALQEAKGRKWGEYVVDRIHLMRSDLFPTGPRYSILHEIRLDPF